MTFSCSFHAIFSLLQILSYQPEIIRTQRQSFKQLQIFAPILIKHKRKKIIQINAYVYSEGLDALENHYQQPIVSRLYAVIEDIIVE